MMECTPESSRCHSVYSVAQTIVGSVGLLQVFLEPNSCTDWLEVGEGGLQQTLEGLLLVSLEPDSCTDWLEVGEGGLQQTLEGR
jgi:hypothetical protein